MSMYHYLMLNRAGTRTGRATYAFFAIFAILATALLNGVEPANPAFLLLYVLSPAVLLLNRLDRSGPTLEEVQEAARARAARDLARRDSTVAFRVGRWLRRRLG